MQAGACFGAFLWDGQRLVEVVGGMHGKVWIEDVKTGVRAHVTIKSLESDGFAVVVQG